MDLERKSSEDGAAFWQRRALEGAWRELYSGPEDLRRHPFLARRRAAFDLIGNELSGVVLDLGCASGDYARGLVERGAKYLGLDPAPRMLVDAKACIDATFLLARAEDLPVKEQSCQYILALGLLGFVRDRERVLLEMQRVMAPGGSLIIQIGKTDLLGRLKGRPKQGTGRERLLSMADLHTHLERLGFRFEARRAIDFVLFPGRLRQRFPSLAVWGSHVLEGLGALGTPFARSLVLRYRKS